jgi:hypothetical protein
MTGDLSDFISRLSAVLPKRWFAQQSPNLEALLGSIATPWVWLYNVILYTVMQTRLGTATDAWLDLIGLDYFGDQLDRKINEADFSYRGRIKSALVREAATRSAVITGLESLTGVPPVVFEPANPSDTGCYGGITEALPIPGMGMAYGEIGGWGSLQLPLQFFITITRPATPGVGMISGYSTPAGGYGDGYLSYVNLSLIPGNVSDQDIQTTLGSLLPVNAVAWLRII